MPTQTDCTSSNSQAIRFTKDLVHTKSASFPPNGNVFLSGSLPCDKYSNNVSLYFLEVMANLKDGAIVSSIAIGVLLVVITPMFLVLSHKSEPEHKFVKRFFKPLWLSFLCLCVVLVFFPSREVLIILFRNLE